MDTNDQYFDCLCRTCMNELVEASSYDGNTKPQQQWLSIFDRIEEECGDFRIAELLTNAVPQIEVQPSDELPKRVCSKCLQQLLSVHRFQQICLQSQEDMRQQLYKKRLDLEMSMIGAASFQPSNTHQTLEHSSIAKPLLEITEQVVKPETAETSDADIDQLPVGCRDAEDNLREFVKNEPIEDDEPSIEYSEAHTQNSIISVKDEEGLSEEIVDQQINETNVEAQRNIHGEVKPYECSYCPQKFSNHTNMIQHKEIHEGQRCYREACDICGESIMKKDLKEHKLTHKDQKPHKCHYCEMSFVQNSNLLIHIRKHTGEKPYKCKYCERSFAQSNNRLKHMRLHLGDNIHRCELCPSAFPLSSELREHLTSHTNEDPATREQNLKALKEAEAELEIKVKENFRAHRNTHAAECPHCSRRFRTKAQMLQHKAIHEGNNREACDICGKSISKKFLKEHKLSHGGEEAHKCHLCEKSFAKNSLLRIHIRKHTGEKPYKCKYCESSFFQNAGLLQHMSLHLGDNVHRCELCPLAFPAASELRAHCITHKDEDPETRERNMKALKEAEAKLEQQQFEIKAKKDAKAHRIMHGEDKPHECPYCPRKFRTKQHMFQHKEIHEAVKGETCDICGKIINKRFLKQHKLGHSNEKPHKCDFCEKRFVQMSHLKCHIVKHTGEKPYKCKYCERSFSYSNHRITHMRVHLGDNVHRCELCPLAFPVASELRMHLTTHKNEDPETRERNMKALKEAEAKLQQQFVKKAKE